MTAPTKWRINVSANNGDSSQVAIGDVQLRSAVGVARPFVNAGFSADCTYSGSANILGAGSLTEVVSANADDDFIAVALPFNITFGNNSYSTCYVGSNGYITFGSGSVVHNAFSGANPPYPSIQISAADCSYQKVYAGSEDGNATFRIRYEGDANSSGPAGASGVVWEVTFAAAAPDTVRLDCGTSNVSSPASGIGDGVYPTYKAALGSGIVNAGYDITTTAITAEGIATASTTTPDVFGVSYGALQAADGLVTTGWISAATNPTGWWQFEFSAPFAAVEYVIQAPGNYGAGVMSNMPQDWTLEYWDGSAWQVADTQSGQTAWSFEEARTFSFVAPSNDGDIMLPTLTVSGVYNVPTDTYLGGDLALLALTTTGGAATANQVGNGAVNLGNALNFGVDATPFAISGVSTIGRRGDGDVMFPALALGGSLEGPLPLPQMSVAGVMIPGRVMTGNIALPALALSGSLNDPLRLPALSVTAAGMAGTVMHGDAMLPAAAVNGIVLAGMIGAGSAELPSWQVAGDSGAGGNIIVPELSISASGQAGAIGTGSALLSKLELGGSLRQDVEGDGAISFSRFTLEAVATSAAVIVGAVTLDGIAVDGVAFSGNIANGSVTLPLWSVTANGHSSVIGTATVTLPMLALDGVLVSTIAAPVFAGVVLNTRTNAVTTYSGGAFNSLCNFNGLVLAAGSAGIVALTGDTDQGAQIDAFLTSGVSDFESDKLKRVIAGYAGYRAAGDMELTLITDEHHEYIYRIEPRQAAIHPAKVKFGRGCDGLYWQWRLANRVGADFSLDSLRLDAEELSRRV